MKPAALTIRQYKSHQFVLDLRPIKQGRKFFASRDEARKARKQSLEALARHGQGWLDLPRNEQAEVMEARKQLAVLGATIKQAANHFIHYLEKVRQCNVTVEQLTARVIEAKEKDGKSARYLESLRSFLGRFCQAFGSRQLATIMPEELDTWLRELPYSPTTRLNFRQYIGVLFSAAKKWRMIDANPIDSTSRPKVIDKPPGILNVSELEQLLSAAARIEPDTIPMLAIGFFAGLRNSEIHRLHWNEIDLKRGEIEVTAAKSKSARRRFVPIQPNLAEWLRPFSKYTGPLVRDYWRGALERVYKESGLREAGLPHLPHNAARHSYASYRLAATDDAPKVAMELGHTTPHLLFNTYRALVRAEDAEAYFHIRPAAEAGNVVTFATS